MLRAAPCRCVPIRPVDDNRSNLCPRCCLKHLFLCREFPPAAYPPGGIGTYVRHITRLLAAAGEVVHVIAHRWAAAPRSREELMDGRLIVHRIELDQAILADSDDPHRELQICRGLLRSSFPAQAFAWNAARLAERLIRTEGIDVVEAQEWEAPLYYLQLRRRLGLGPEHCPPCVVHLHSSTEQIFSANDWDTSVADYAPAVAQEAFSITEADALIAPSQFIARQALARYAIDPSRIHVIPYPIGDSVCLTRTDAIWAGRSICHIGRMEPRKGVFECVDAIVTIAADYPDLRVDFVGGDMPLEVTGGPSVTAALRQRIPKPFRHQVRFHGIRDRSGVSELLARASAVVVPSRWENFPYSCIEAMASGLAVVVSPNGGMRELVEDGVSGWVAAAGTPAGLATALRRALDTPGEQRGRMGRAAAAHVVQKCANEAVVRRHLELKYGITQQARAQRTATYGAPALGTASSHMAVVVRGSARSTRLDLVRRGLRGQVESPAIVVVVGSDLAPDTITTARAEGWEVRPGDGENQGSRLSAVVAELLLRPDLLGIVLVDADVQLDPAWLRICRVAFEHDDRLAVISAWTLGTVKQERVHVQANPARPDLLDDATPAPFVAVRSSALLASGCGLDQEPGAAWSRVFERILQSGWSALTYPAVLGATAPTPGGFQAPHNAFRHSSMARAIQRLHTPLLQWLLDCSPGDRREFLRDALRSPLRSLRLLAQRTLFAVRRRPNRQPQSPMRAAHSTNDARRP